MGWWEGAADGRQGAEGSVEYGADAAGLRVLGRWVRWIMVGGGGGQW
jgi:hypothetical protein